jgi:hypothetical protein
MIFLSNLRRKKNGNSRARVRERHIPQEKKFKTSCELHPVEKLDGLHMYDAGTIEGVSLVSARRPIFVAQLHWNLGTGSRNPVA